MTERDFKKPNYSGKRKNKSDEILKKFADMMVKIIETAKANNWKKGWMGVNGSVQGLPQNISGRTYSGGNSFFLMFNTAEQGYKTPVYMTFLQAKDQNLQVKPVEKSVPVFKWGLSIKDEDGNKISEEVYNTMSKEERSKLIVRPFPRVFSVFNIDQTNLEEVNKKKYDAIVARFKVPEQEVKDTDGMYVNEALDRMFETKAWYAKIQYDKPSEQAFYRPSTDTIVLPMKSQFKLGQTPEEVYRDGMEYYSTALHEMAHSTGHEDRLDRSFGQHGTDNYAHEELIAEMTSALVGSTMGFDRKILENNANYLSGWLNRLKGKPETISTIMTDVGKASDMIIDKIDEQRIALNQKPLKAGNLEGIDGELAQTKERGKTLYDLQKKYSRINGQYPASVDDDRTRQIAKRIRQAEQIIMAYNANVVSVYGEQFVFSAEAQTRIIPQAIYSGRERPVLETKEENISSDEKPQKNEDMKVQVSTAPFTREIPTWETYEKEKGKDGDFTYQETAEEYGKTLLNGVEDILPRVKGTIYINQWGEKSLTAKIDGLVEVFVSRYIPDTLSAWVDAMPKEETHVNMQSSYTSKSVDIAAAYIFSAVLSQKEGQQITLSFSDDKQSWKTIDEVNQAKQEGLLSVGEFEALSALESSKGIPEEGIIPNAISTLKNRVRNSEYFGYDLKEGVKEAIDILESGKITAAYTVTDKHEEAQTISLPKPEELDKSPQKEEVTEMSSLSEDSNPATNVAGIAEKIMEGGHVSKEVAEKKAAVIAEAQQSAVEEKKQKIEQAKQTAAKAREDERRREVEEQKRREEENRREEKDSGYTSKIFLHAALLLGALELAKGNKGIWMNKAGKSNAEFLWAKTPITPYNNLMMNLQSDQKGYRSNVYAYFDELKNVGDSVKTNEKALPFNWTRWDYQNIATKDVITKGEYQGLPEDEKSLYVKHHTRQTQQIFNIDQTSLTGKEMYSDLLKETGAKYEELSERGVTNMINYSEKLKSNHPTAIVVARNDNQYHIYGNDATRAGKILGLPVGQTEVNGQKIKSTGFPLDRIDDYLPKLVQAKQWVVVADNLDSSELIKRVANEKDVLNKAYSTAQKVAKSAGIGYERVMVLQDAEYDKQADKIIVSGMMDKNSGNSRQAAIAKANDIYRAIVAATGSEQRLDRMGRNNLLPNDDAKYERFVQDLSAGILMARQGLPASLSKESMQHIDYWKREIKENPKLLGLLEKDVNNAVESIDKHMQKQLVKYEEIRKDLPLKDLAVSERQYQISTDLSKLPDIDSKEIVIVRDTAKGSADVILPEGASLEDNVEISGIRDRKSVV